MTMMTYLHSLLRWAIIILGIITLIRSLRGMNGTRAFLPADKKSALFLMIACDLQLLAGLYLYFTSAWGLKNIQSQGMGAVMKDAASRFFAVEHSLGMLVALLLVHLGYRAVKKDMPDTGKFKKLFWFTLLAFIIIMATIPWPFRAGIARPWLFGLSA